MIRDTASLLLMAVAALWAISAIEPVTGQALHTAAISRMA